MIITKLFCRGPFQALRWGSATDHYPLIRSLSLGFCLAAYWVPVLLLGTHQCSTRVRSPCYAATQLRSYAPTHLRTYLAKQLAQKSVLPSVRSRVPCSAPKGSSHCSSATLRSTATQPYYIGPSQNSKQAPQAGSRKRNSTPLSINRTGTQVPAP